MTTKEKPEAAPAVSDDALDALLEKVDARRAANERLAKIAAAGENTERRPLKRLHEVPAPVAQVLRPGENALAQDRVDFPRDAVLRKDAILEFPVGYLPIDLAGSDPSRPLFRIATPDEVASGVTIQMAAKFLTVEREAEDAVDLEKAALADRARNSDLVARARQALEHAEARLVNSEGVLASAGRHREAEAQRLARWIASSGKSEADLRAAVALMKPPAPEPASKPRIHFPPGHIEPDAAWHPTPGTSAAPRRDREFEKKGDDLAETAVVVQS